VPTWEAHAGPPLPLMPVCLSVACLPVYSPSAYVEKFDEVGESLVPQHVLQMSLRHVPAATQDTSSPQPDSQTTWIQARQRDERKHARQRGREGERERGTEGGRGRNTSWCTCVTCMVVVVVQSLTGGEGERSTDRRGGDGWPLGCVLCCVVGGWVWVWCGCGCGCEWLPTHVHCTPCTVCDVPLPTYLDMGKKGLLTCSLYASGTCSTGMPFGLFCSRLSRP